MAGFLSIHAGCPVEAYNPDPELVHQMRSLGLIATRAEIREEALKEGMRMGTVEMACELVADQLITPETGAEKLGISVAALRAEMEKAGYHFPEEIKEYQEGAGNVQRHRDRGFLRPTHQ